MPKIVVYQTASVWFVKNEYFMAKIDVCRSLLPSDRVIGRDIKMTSHPNSNASFINIWDRLIWRRSPNLTRSSKLAAAPNYSFGLPYTWYAQWIIQKSVNRLFFVPRFLYHDIVCNWWDSRLHTCQVIMCRTKAIINVCVITIYISDVTEALIKIVFANIWQRIDSKTIMTYDLQLNFACTQNVLW